MTDIKPTNIALLGSTGSIGTQTLDIVAAYPDLFRVVLLSARRNWQRLAEQALRFRPRAVVIADESCLLPLREALSGAAIKIYCGNEVLNHLVAEPEVDIVVAAMVGYAGLSSTVAAAKAGKKIALANKETLVAAGSIVTDLCRRHGATLLPVDSEHSAIFQCLQGQDRKALRSIILTASGGPFRDFTATQLESVTPEQALRHPNWQMGRKVTIDSASMMNKGFEMIEAHWLFSCAPEKIRILVHPQSIVHSMVEFEDGAVIAQLGLPDMHLPIRYALSYPRRLPAAGPRLEAADMVTLTFREADTERFPMLAYAFEAINRGGTIPAAMAAADEVAVQAFLDHRISFTGMARLVHAVMDHSDVITDPNYNDIIQADAEARRLANELLSKI